MEQAAFRFARALALAETGRPCRPFSSDLRFSRHSAQSRQASPQVQRGIALNCSPDSARQDLSRRRCHQCSRRDRQPLPPGERHVQHCSISEFGEPSSAQTGAILELHARKTTRPSLPATSRHLPVYATTPRSTPTPWPGGRRFRPANAIICRRPQGYPSLPELEGDALLL